jgi:hypothetical protein
MSFYLHLPSNVCPNYFPNNRISSYKTKLPQRFKFLPTEYEVALMEFSYVNSLLTFPNKSDRGVHLLLDLEETTKTGGFKYLANQNYSSIVTLINALNDVMKTKNGAYGMFSFNTLLNRVQFSYKLGALQISNRLSHSLGFHGIQHLDSRTATARFPPDTSGGMYHIFVYSDIVEPQIVGDTLAPLLRMVNIGGIEGQAVTQTFRPFYVPVSRLEFDTIEILLCNEFGEEIQFEKGQSIVTLHFRKLKNGN